MKKTALVVGFGPGISSAMAEKLGAAGYAVALVARNEAHLVEGAKALAAKKIDAKAIPADASDPKSIRAAVKRAREELGPIALVHWNAYGGPSGDLLTIDPAELKSTLDVAVVGLVSAVQEALADLKAAKGAVLVTNGAFGEVNPGVDAYAVKSGATGLAIANAAKHKLVGLLAARLESEGVYVGEVMVAGTVKGTRWDQGSANLDASTIANAFWKLLEGRSEIRARVG